MKRKLLGLALAAVMASAGLPAAASAAQAQTPASATGRHGCIDATKAENVNVVWYGANKVAVSTKYGKRACSEARVIFAVYVVPDLWDGQGLNETAFPQQVIKHTPSVVLSEEPQILSLPEVIDCKNAQFDVYYAPHITRLMWPEAHGKQFISARFQHFG